jgi:hypothetical protein
MALNSHGKVSNDPLVRWTPLQTCYRRSLCCQSLLVRLPLPLASTHTKPLGIVPILLLPELTALLPRKYSFVRNEALYVPAFSALTLLSVQQQRTVVKYISMRPWWQTCKPSLVRHLHGEILLMDY